MNEPIGYVVVVWTGKEAAIIDYSFVEVGHRAEVEELAVAERAAAAHAGRGERYAVAEVVPLEDPS